MNDYHHPHDNSHRGGVGGDGNADREEQQQQQQQQEGVTAESYGAVTTTDANNQVWLLRIPPKLAQAFHAAPEGTVLGDLVFTKGGVIGKDGKPSKPSFTVHVSEELAEATAADGGANAGAAAAAAAALHNNLPLHYSLQSMTKKVPVLHPFVRHDTNGSTTIWGTVSRTANVQVQQDARYRAQLKDRLVATNITSQRFVRPMENTESVTSRTTTTTTAAAAGPWTSSSTTRQASFGNAVYQFGKRRLDALQQQKDGLAAGGGAGTGAGAAHGGKAARRFTADQNLRSVLFDLFQQQPYWTVKDLKAAAVAGGATHAASSKADSKMRDILKTIGEYHRSGDHKTMWSLRKEYQQG